MSTRTLTMRSIRELYRLKFEAGLSHQQIARALAVSKGVVAKYARLAEAAGLTPAELLALPEQALLARLRPTRPAPVRHVPPDYATIHQELKRKANRPDFPGGDRYLPALCSLADLTLQHPPQ